MEKSSLGSEAKPGADHCVPTVENFDTVEKIAHIGVTDEPPDHWSGYP